MKIHLLPDTLISQIAAGEVVERPASVLKELIENSIDAGATICDIELEQGGLKTIAIRDNGCGMNRTDAQLSFARHATSKIATFDDLISIDSFGFRGEALAAIASVSHVTMKTREQSSEHGYEIVYQGGLHIADGTIGCAPGTEIVVHNLFFNTPARKKFLKTESTELQHCILVVTTIALAYPTIAFSLTHNGRELLRVAATQDSLTRIGALLGTQFIRDSAPVEFITPSIDIQGIIGKPGMTLSSKRHQYLFVNGRPVSDASISHAVVEAYGTRLPARTYPLFVLCIDIDPKEVDVNVHPRKLTVKFAEPGRVYRDTLQAAKAGLDKAFLSSISMRTDMTVRPRATDPYASIASSSNVKDKHSIQEALTFTEAMLKVSHATDDIKDTRLVKNSTLFGQLENSYILMHSSDGLTIIDQHAAHERIQYEKLKAQYEEKNNKGTLPIQYFLVPLQIELTAAEASAYNKIETILACMGFIFEHWSGGVVIVQAAPAAFKEKETVHIIKSLVSEIIEDSASTSALPERLLKSLACKAAVKFGMPLNTEEQYELVEALEKTVHNATCPHGRPTRLLLSLDELERRFYRKK